MLRKTEIGIIDWLAWKSFCIIFFVALCQFYYLMFQSLRNQTIFIAFATLPWGKGEQRFYVNPNALSL
jgi:hypothetical protein